MATMTAGRLVQHTYAVTVVTWQRRRMLQTARNAELAIATLIHHHAAARFQLHGFVIMPNHAHVLITPAAHQSTSRCVQLIKGGISHAIGRPAIGELWQSGHHEHRIRDERDFTDQLRYIANNPSQNPFPYVHTHSNFVTLLAPMPLHLQEAAGCPTSRL